MGALIEPGTDPSEAFRPFRLVNDFDGIVILPIVTADEMPTDRSLVPARRRQQSTSRAIPLQSSRADPDFRLEGEPANPSLAVHAARAAAELREACGSGAIPRLRYRTAGRMNRGIASSVIQRQPRLL